MQVEKLREAANAFRIAASALEEVANSLVEHETIINEITSRVDKNEAIRKQLYEVLKNAEEY